jgi:hypothetical protein
MIPQSVVKVSLPQRAFAAHIRATLHCGFACGFSGRLAEYGVQNQYAIANILRTPHPPTHCPSSQGP